MKEYYRAYDERYRTVHSLGLNWTSAAPTLVVAEVIEKYHIPQNAKLLDIGCGEGRDAFPLLEAGYDLTATDVSPEAIRYCRSRRPSFADRFLISDCMSDSLPYKFDFIYSVAVLHMFVKDEHRKGFYRFIREHLAPGGMALVCSMGDGIREYQTDTAAAFETGERQCGGNTVTVAQTTCRIVNKASFLREITEAGFMVNDYSLSPSPPEFDLLMCAVIQKR